MAADPPPAPLAKVAVSECLLGRRVRWDGDHNADVWPRRTVEALFTLVGLCPEVGIGMGVPRQPIRLIGEAANPRAVMVADPRIDFTAELAGFARRSAPVLGQVAGYIFANRSPSCGLSGVKVFAADGSHRRIGRGIYASAVLAAHPTLPAVDAETLADEDVLLDFAVAVARVAGGPLDRDGIRERIRTLIGCDVKNRNRIERLRHIRGR